MMLPSRLGCPLSLKTHNMGNPHSYRIDRRLSGLAGPDYDATISFGLPLESENPQYGKSRYNALDGPNWEANENWLTDAPMGEWSGVTTDDKGRVTVLVLASGCQ